MSEVSDVVTEWFNSDETMEEEVDTPAPAPKDPGDICGPFVWPYSLLWKLTAPLTPVLTEDPG